MKKIKKRVIIVILIILSLFIIWVGTLSIYLYMWVLAAEPYVVEKTIKTPYGDNFYIEYTKGSVGLQPTEVSFQVLYNNELIVHLWNMGTGFYETDMDETRMHIVVNMSAEGEVRAYEFNWGILYTMDDGKSFKGVFENLYMEYYTGNEEFEQIYSMLHKRPFYDERFKEHLDMDKRELPESETAEYIVSESENRELTISEIESQMGKAQRVSRIETFEEDEKVDKVEDAYMEYDLSDGRILAIRYYNRGDGDNLDLYVSRAYIREVYNPAEEEECPGEAPVPSAFPSPSAAAA